MNRQRDRRRGGGGRQTLLILDLADLDPLVIFGATLLLKLMGASRCRSPSAPA
jgi:hypothetical protein